MYGLYSRVACDGARTVDRLSLCKEFFVVGHNLEHYTGHEQSEKIFTACLGQTNNTCAQVESSIEIDATFFQGKSQ